MTHNFVVLNPDYRRARLLAVLLDLAVPTVIADAVALALAFLLWRLLPGERERIGWIFLPAAAAALASFLLRDVRGGRARKWLALEVRDREGGLPGAWTSIRRNLLLLLPVWNLFEAWPVFRDGLAARRSDARHGLQVRPCD
jgi:hypothetical protein